MSRTGLKIFAMGQFAKEVNSQPKEEIYFRKINFAILPYGDRIEECLNNVEVAIPDLRFVKGLFAVANRRLFYSENCGLQRVGVETLSSYVGNLV